MRRLLGPVLLSLAILAPATPARAGWFPAQPVDAGASAVGNVALAPDGTGGVVYTKGPVPHVYLSRLIGGAWTPPELVDGGGPLPSADPGVAAGRGGVLVVAWRHAGQVLGSYAAGGPLTAPVVLGQGDVGPPDA